MKYLTLCLIVAALCSNSCALPAKKRVMYYQPAAQWMTAPQHMMFMRYVQPGGTHARSTQAAAALVADEGVAAGSLYENPEGTLTVEAAQNPINNEQAIGVEVDVADAASPAFIPNDEQRDIAVPDVVEPEVPIAADESPVPETAALPGKRVLPIDNSNSNDSNKRVFIELQPAAENEIPTDEQNTPVVVPQDAVSDDDDDIPIVQLPKFPARVPYTPRSVARKPNKPAATPKPLPAGTFFPVDFGGVNGGAVAIAHSLSTDAGGSATSNAIAYGNPSAVESARLRARRH